MIYQSQIRAAVQLIPSCCLRTSSSLVRNKGVTRCFPSPFSGPQTTPTLILCPPTILCVCFCVCEWTTASTTGCAILGQFILSHCDSSDTLFIAS